jgi:hypothetical protein
VPEVKRIGYAASIALTTAFFLLAASLDASAREKEGYVMLKGGLVTFTGDLKRADLDTGFNGEVSCGRYLSPNFALEAGIGYFHDGVNKYYGNNVWVIPLTVSLKGIYRSGLFELYAGGGPGIYPAKFNGMVNNAVGEKWMTVLGGHLLAGATLDVSRSLFVGLEGKLHFTADADFRVVRSNLNSRSLSVILGCRF